MNQTNLPGFYGKFPELGDFVNRRIPRSFLDHWDEWLQNAIATSRQRLDKDWLNLYLNSPVWRFALAGGLCGDQPWCGLLMPSVDRVGRYYPLTIAAPLPLDANLIQVALDGSGWYEAGDSVMFDNHRVLHARTEFSDGERHLQICNVGRETFHERLRLLAASLGFEDEADMVLAAGVC